MYEAMTLSRSLERAIGGQLSRLGLMFRVFGRAKSIESLRAKLEREPSKYSSAVGGKKVQDGIGVRIALYFRDDLDVVTTCVRQSYEVLDIVEDALPLREFGPTRMNIVARVPPPMRGQLLRIYGESKLDDTFEIQVRTVLSEGWHEVEHDLRYKRPEDWSSFDDLSRTLNGVVATLETAEWTLLKVFEELAWRHYKDRNWEAMIRNKFRLRLHGAPLSPEIESALSADDQLSKDLFRIDRNEFLLAIAAGGFGLPMTADNICHIANHIALKREVLFRLAPDVVQLKLHGSSNFAVPEAEW